MKDTLRKYIVNRVPLAQPDDLVDNILDKIRKSEFAYSQHIFVTDKQNRLKGYIELSIILKSGSSVPLSELLSPCLTIDSDVTLEYAASHAITRKKQFVPVTDQQGVFIGILSPQTIIETLRKEHIEDLHKIAGIRKEMDGAERAINEGPLRSVWHRLPWLLVGLLGSFLATFIMGSYEELLNSNISLAFFIPGIVYLADAVGTQTETIVIRGLSLNWSTFTRVLKKEFLTGWLIGVILAVLTLPVALLAGYSPQISIVVGLSVMVAGTLATTIGLLLPWLLQKFGIDPAFGSGPLATIIQDILSILVYLLIARTLLTSI